MFTFTIQEILLKNKLLAAVIMMLISSFAFGQSGWSPLNTGTQQNFYSSYFVTENLGYAVGWNGTVIKTSDAGITWHTLSFPVTTELRSVNFTTENTGYIVTSGYGNKIYKTTDGGNIWTEITMPVYCSFLYVTFLNLSTGFVSGNCGNILKTTNAGETWSICTTPGESMSFFSLHFTSMVTGYAPERSGNILKTTDGGESWFIIYSHGSDDRGFYSVSFKDANTGVAVGGLASNPLNSNPVIVRTTNGGTTWYDLSYDNGSTSLLWSVNFVSPQIAFIVGKSYNPLNRSIILKTTNAGLTWYQQVIPATTFLSGISFTSENTGYVTGYTGLILKTTNGGGDLTGIDNENNEISDKFILSQNYPNPFNPSTSISFSLPNESRVNLIVFDQLGREIQQLTDAVYKAGRYEIEWDAAGYPSGIYFYKLVAEGFSETKRMVLIK